MRKYKIRKRRDGDDSGYSRDTWPWRIIYPGGDYCLVLTFEAAVAHMDRQLRYLKSDYEALDRERRRLQPGYIA